MKIQLETSNGNWVLTDLEAKKDRIKIFDDYPVKEEVLEFVEKNKK